MAAFIRYESGVEIVDLNGRLADGSLQEMRRKFSEQIRHERMLALIAEVTDGTLYLGDWRKGEIEIIGIESIATNRFWTEVTYHVLFPPIKGTEPKAGTYRNLVWNPGETPGCGALLLSPQRELIVVRSFRHAVRSWRLEIPAGARRPGESDEDCAEREAREECGVISYGTRRRIGMIQPETGVLRSHMPVYAFTDVVVDPAKVRRDVSESVMGPVIMSFEQYRQYVLTDEINDARLLAAVEKARAHGLIAA